MNTEKQAIIVTVELDAIEAGAFIDWLDFVKPNPGADPMMAHKVRTFRNAIDGAWSSRCGEVVSVTVDVDEVEAGDFASWLDYMKPSPENNEVIERMARKFRDAIDSARGFEHNPDFIRYRDSKPNRQVAD